MKSLDQKMFLFVYFSVGSRKDLIGLHNAYLSSACNEYQVLGNWLDNDVSFVASNYSLNSVID